MGIEHVEMIHPPFLGVSTGKQFGPTGSKKLPAPPPSKSTVRPLTKKKGSLSTIPHIVPTAILNT